MIYIRKGAPPSALVTYQQALDASANPPRRARYDGPGFEAVKPAVREALHAEQRGLCCYCNNAIGVAASGMKIEHRVPQRGEHGDASRDLDWTNLFGACMGGEQRGRSNPQIHCDASKGEQALAFDPSDPTHVATVDYEGSGRITSSRREFQRELDEVLRLNDVPREERRRALDFVQRELSKRYPDKRFPTDRLRRLREETLSPRGMRLRAYAGFIAWWVDKRIRQQSNA